jgi:hypothetical protein
MAGIIFSEGSGVNDSVFGKSQAPIRLFIEKRGEEFERASLINELFQVSKSTHYGEKMTSMTAMDGFQATGENGAYPLDGMQEGYSKTLEHMTWKNSFSLSQEIIEDSKMMDLRKKPAAFITSYYRTREKFGAAIYGHAIQGLSTLSFAGKSFSLTCADGEPLFDNAHPAKVSGDAQCNVYADAFSSDALGMMEVIMQNFRGDNNEILDVAPDTILIPNVHALKKAVFAAIGADKDPETANNGFNYQYGRWNVICWPYLNQFIGSTNTAPWVLLDSRYNEEYGGAVWLDRTPLSVRSTIDENTDANVWRGRSRFIAGFHDWRFACVGGITGATSLS